MARKTPTLLGKKMQQRPGDVWLWARGAVVVQIEASTSGSIPDWKIWVVVFGIAVIENWRGTLDEAVALAERKLLQIQRALTGGKVAR